MAAQESDDYFVLFAADDVRKLTLDQLDDAYRLSVIDESTLLWQDGFDGWKSLAEVAGLEDDEEEAELVADVEIVGGPNSHVRPVAVAPAHVPPRSMPPGAATPSIIITQPPPAAPSSVPTQPFNSALPAAATPSSVPTQPVTDTIPAPAPTSSFAPGSPTMPAPAPTFPAPTPAPLDLYQSSYGAPKASPWFRRGLIAATALGALLIAHQNGVIYSLASAVGQAGALEKLEKSFGGPSIATPRGLEGKLASLRQLHRLDELSHTEPVEKKAQPAPSTDESKPREGTEAQASAPPSEKADSKTAKSPAPQSKTESGAAARMKAALTGKPLKTTAAPPARPAKKKRGPSIGVGIRGGDPNDPMNGSL